MPYCCNRHVQGNLGKLDEMIQAWRASLFLSRNASVCSFLEFNTLLTIKIIGARYRFHGLRASMYITLQSPLSFLLQSNVPLEPSNTSLNINSPVNLSD